MSVAKRNDVTETADPAVVFAFPASVQESVHDQLNKNVLTAIKIETDRLEDFDFDRIRDEILSVPTNQFVSSFVKVNKNWDGIALVGPNGMHTWNLGLGGNFLDTPILDALPHTRAFLHALPLKLQSVRISCLGPQGKIMPHRDHDLYGGLVRMHLVLKTNEHVDFRIGDHKIPMREGDLWYGNFNLTHTVENVGAEERIHLLIDGYAVEETSELFDSGKEKFDQFLKSAHIKDGDVSGQSLLGKKIRMTLNDATRERSLICSIERTKHGLGLKLSGTPIFVADLFPYSDDGFVVNGTPFKFSSADEKCEYLSIDVDNRHINRLKQLISDKSFEERDLSRNDAVRLQNIDPTFPYMLATHAKQYLMYVYLARIAVFMDQAKKRGTVQALRGALRH